VAVGSSATHAGLLQPPGSSTTPSSSPPPPPLGPAADTTRVSAQPDVKTQAGSVSVTSADGQPPGKSGKQAQL
jgi:hypothetical protein